MTTAKDVMKLIKDNDVKYAVSDSLIRASGARLSISP
jgi:hypothetical protein